MVNRVWLLGISATAVLLGLMVKIHRSIVEADAEPEEGASSQYTKSNPPIIAISKKQAKRLANKLKKREKRQTVHHGVTKRQNRRIEEAYQELRSLLSVEPGESMEETQVHERIRKLFRVRCPYDQLVHDCGPLDRLSECISWMKAMACRPEKYESKMIPQEVSLIHKMFILLDGRQEVEPSKPLGSSVAVLDIGAGNGCLGLFTTLILNCPVFLIDREAPNTQLQTENMVPEALSRRMVRFVSDIGTLDVGQMVSFLRSNGICQVIVCAKHLCGLGTDLAIRFAERLKGYQDEKGSIEVLGIVAATCCVNKIDGASEVSRYCGFYPSLMQNREEFVTSATHKSTWRTSAKVKESRLTPGQISLSELYEDVLQSPRLAKLGSLFGHAKQIIFSAQEFTLQNRALLAFHKASALDGVGRGTSDAAFMAALESAAAYVHSQTPHAGPIDLCPKGIISTKYAYDGAAPCH